MQVVSSSAEIIEDNENIYKDIEERGRICYKSEDKITSDSAEKFIKFAINKRHQTVLEMRSISLKIKIEPERVVTIRDMKAVSPWIICDCLPSAFEYIVTASPRAFREAYEAGNYFAQLIMEYLRKEYPILFNDLPQSDIDYDKIFDIESIDIDNYRDSYFYKDHKHVCVKFIVNRAISHELVRHRQQMLQESQRYCRYNESVIFVEPSAFWDKGTNEYMIWEQQMLSSEKAYLKLLETSSPQAARTVLANSCKTELYLDMSLARWKHFFCLRTSTGAEPSMREVAIPLLEKFKKKFDNDGYFDSLKVSLIGK